MKAVHANLSPFHVTKLVAMATSLDRKFTKILAIGTFSSIVLTQQSVLRCVHLLSNEKSDSLKKENRR